MKHVFFDLDGVLLNTYSWIIESYRRAGAMPPDDILSREGDPWLIRDFGVKEAKNVHIMKNNEYKGFMKGHTLPYTSAFMVAMHLITAGHRVSVISGAPTGTMDILRTRDVRWSLFAEMYDGVNTPAKMQIFRDIAYKHADITDACYVDDQNKNIDLPPDWRFIHYRGEDSMTLYDKIINVHVDC
jgi:hypothetical protein